MLIQFTVGNYRSFKDLVTLSMVAANLTAKDKTLDENNTFAATGKLRLLKSAAIYGANASGKSNLVKALKFMREFVINSARESQAGDPIFVEPFRLSAKTQTEPSFFEIVFLSEGIKYRYGFEADAKKVLSEWLFYTPKTKEVNLFTREESSISYSAAFKEGKNLDSRTRSNALFLSVVAQFNGKLATNILRWFEALQILSGLEDVAPRRVSELWLEKEHLRGAVLDFMQKMDLGIVDVRAKKVAVAPFSLSHYPADVETVIQTIHKKFDDNGHTVAEEIFDLEENESDGTKKIFAFAGPFLNLLQTGGTIVIDELDARLHPLVTQSVIRLFKTPQTQLIFTTHDTNLLSNKSFRRDQIWFTEKDKYGATALYSLVEYRVRNDASYEKDYIAGKYGAIPFISSLDLRESVVNG